VTRRSGSDTLDRGALRVTRRPTLPTILVWPQIVTRPAVTRVFVDHDRYMDAFSLHLAKKVRRRACCPGT